jgi:hypothetical protein
LLNPQFQADAEAMKAAGFEWRKTRSGRYWRFPDWESVGKPL